MTAIDNVDVTGGTTEAINLAIAGIYLTSHVQSTSSQIASHNRQSVEFNLIYRRPEYVSNSAIHAIRLTTQ